MILCLESNLRKKEWIVLFVCLLLVKVKFISNAMFFFEGVWSD